MSLEEDVISISSSNLCVNCNEAGGISELAIVGFDGFTKDDCSTDEGTITISNAVSYIYGISRKDFIEIFEPEKTEERIENYKPCDLIFCVRCATLLSECYRYQKSLENVRHSRSSLKITEKATSGIKGAVGCANEWYTIKEADQNQNDQSWDEGDNISLPVDFEVNDDNDNQSPTHNENIEVKYMFPDETPNPSTGKCVYKELSVHIDRIPQVVLDKIFNKGQRKLTKNKKISGTNKSKRKLSKKEKVSGSGKEHTEAGIVKEEGVEQIKIEPDWEIEETVKEYKCRICKEIFPKKSLMTRHLRSAHQRGNKSSELTGPIECELCGKICSSFQYYVYRHIPYFHQDSDTPQHMCQICGKSFRVRHGLSHHLKTVHLDEEERNEKKVECEVCGKRFPRATYNVHLKIHNKDRKVFKCDHCGKEYFTRDKYRYHMMMHTSAEQFTCQFCQKVFAGKYALKRHEQRHNSDNKSHVCDVCGKGFRENNLLMRHKVMHQSERPFACEKCGKTFKNTNYLYLHNKSSHGSKMLFVEDFGSDT